MLLSFLRVLIGLWLCTAVPTDLGVVHEGQVGPALGFSGLSRNGSALLVKLSSQGRRPESPWVSEHTGAIQDVFCFCCLAGTSVGGLNSRSLGLACRVRPQLFAPVCPHSSWSRLTLGSWWVNAAVATTSCCCCQCTPSATWG